MYTADRYMIELTLAHGGLKVTINKHRRIDALFKATRLAYPDYSLLKVTEIFPKIALKNFIINFPKLIKFY